MDAQIVKLASHDILAVREAAWQMCRASLPRLKQDMDTASRLVDAKWEDSRQFAFGLLRDAFHREELSPAVLVSLCDSVRPDVQQFGKEMVTRLFAEQDGPEYAIRLSEHPGASMQMFAANFLERYAGTDPGRLRELAENATVPVINGLTDTSHPCQLMADVMTFEEHRGPIKGRTVAWSGDANNVLTSWAHAAARLDFTLNVAPEIKSVAELKGKSIGCTAPGSTTWVLARMIAKHQGWNPDKDVQVVAKALGSDS